MITKKQRNMIVASLRKIWLWSPERKEAKKAVRCAKCKQKADYVIDHIEPVFEPHEPDPFTTTSIWTCTCKICRWFQRLFCDQSGLQALCKPCHQKKSNEENTERRAYRKENKRDKKVNRGK